jgi:hypothetical protein
LYFKKIKLGSIFYRTSAFDLFVLISVKMTGITHILWCYEYVGEAISSKSYVSRSHITEMVSD